ncbi:hypothetical protein [Plantactinospora sonchi]|uniref:Uncharacterized protein n=1 Tax=Plantactinospora sonchi TaxID=1544735 RepID=A0ABU7RSQ0_9ACTN
MAYGSIPFNHYLLEKNLTDIGTYLTELRYIDQVVTYLDSVASSLWEVIREGLGSAGTSGHSDIVVDFTGTAPFRRAWRLPEGGGPGLSWRDQNEDEAWQQIRKYEVEAREWAGANLTTIREMVTPMLHPAGSVYLDDMIWPVRDALHRLEDHVPNDFGKLTYSLGDWKGDAAQEFAANFYHPFQHTLESHRRMLSAFAGSLASARAIVEATQQSLMNVVHHTREALLEQLRLRSQHAAADSEKSVKNVLVLASAVVPVFTSDNRWEVGLELAGAAAALGEAAMKEHVLTGSTAEELLLALTGALTVIENHSGDQYVALDREVQNVLARMKSILHRPDGEDGQLVPSRPRLVDGTDSSDFYMPAAR